MYRTPAGGRPSDALVICRACGAAKAVAFDDASSQMIECPACHVEQAALRGREDMAVEEMTLADEKHLGSYDALHPFMRELGGADTKPSQITVRCDGIDVLVSVSTNSGSVVGVELVAMTNGLPPMTLTRETEAHRRAASKGVVREVQTGDRELDEGVYIESGASDRDVSVALSSPAVRAAVMNLLTVVSEVRVNPDHVKVVVGMSDHPFDPGALRERIGWLRVLAGAPRPTSTTYVDIPLSVTLTNIAPMFILPMALLLLFVGGHQYSPLDGKFALYGAPLGLVIAFALFPVVGRLLRGRSSSLRDILRTRAILVVALPLFSMGVALTANGGLDRSAARTIEMKVLSTSVDSDDSSKIDVHAQAPDGSTHSFSFTASTPQGPARVQVRLHPGRFGWSWQEGDALLLVGAAPPASP